jgi:hypothetical protein
VDGSKRETVVELSLDGHCVGTAARRALTEIEGVLLGAGGEDRAQEGLEQKHELLRRFLSATDLASLRASRPELTGRIPIRVRLRDDGEGGFTIERLD